MNDYTNKECFRMSEGGEGRQQVKYDYAAFVEGHRPQLQAADVPEKFWPTVFFKIANELFDAGDHFQLICEEGEGGKEWSVQAVDDMEADEDCNVFIVDHAWTFRPSQARRQLEQMPQLLGRMCELMAVEDDCDECGSDDEEGGGGGGEKEESGEGTHTDKIDGSLPRQASVSASLCEAVAAWKEETVVDRVLRAMWRHANTYTVHIGGSSSEPGLPVWYVMDEFGSRIAHSDQPNARVVPLFFAPHGLAYSLLFLTRNVHAQDDICRDYADTVLCKQHPDWRCLLLLPWMGEEGEGDTMEGAGCKRQPVPDEFYMSGRNPDELADEDAQCVAESAQRVGREHKVRIIADDAQLIKNLSIPYELVSDWRTADVVWMLKHFHDYKDLCEQSPMARVNQFPFENVLTVKDLLSATLMQMRDGQGPQWFQTSFNLMTELPQFVAHYKHRQRRGVDNTWIVKPWNLARGLDMTVSNDLSHIIRLIETGPKLACKYIERPVLFSRPDTGNRVKFDLRFILFVNQLRPVKAHLYNKFWIRFGINEFSLQHLDDVETHFTVFNYVADKTKVLNMECDEFVRQLEASYPQLKWKGVQEKINGVLREMLEAVSREDPPRGVASNAQSRAMYGVDIMLQWADKTEREVQVTVLECNFMPDCARACTYYPDFADTVVNTMFLDNIDSDKVTHI